MSKLFASCTVRVLPPRGRGDKRLVADGAAVHEVMVASHGPADYPRCVDWKQVGSNSCYRRESRNTDRWVSSDYCCFPLIFQCFLGF